MNKLILKMARNKYGRIYLQSKNKKKIAEEVLFANLSVLHDSYRNEEWAKKLREVIAMEEFI